MADFLTRELVVGAATNETNFRVCLLALTDRVAKSPTTRTLTDEGFGHKLLRTDDTANEARGLCKHRLEPTAIDVKESEGNGRMGRHGGQRGESRPANGSKTEDIVVRRQSSKGGKNELRGRAAPASADEFGSGTDVARELLADDR